MRREADISTYWPWVVGNTREFKALGTGESPELTEAWEGTERVLMNQFLFDSDEYGVRRRERMLGLIPLASDTLDDRKRRIYLLMNEHLPYTWRVLLERLELLCGEGNWVAKLYPLHYLLTVRVTADALTAYLEVEDYLRQRMLPANIALRCADTNSWADVLGVRFWAEYREQTWGELLAPRVWDQYRGDAWEGVLRLRTWEAYEGLTWGDLQEKSWGEVLGAAKWGDLLSERTWGPILGQNKWRCVKRDNPDWHSVHQFEGVKEE